MSFGPGTKTNLKLKRKDWKAIGGAIENKNRPESLYIVFSSWVKPKMNVVKAKAHSTDDIDSLAIEIIKQFDKELGTLKRKVVGFFDPKFFDTSSIIFTYDIAVSQASFAKSQFLELEINIDTVNTIDMQGNPIAHRGTGKVNHLKFSDFVKPMENALNKILEMDSFNPVKSGINYSLTKGG